MTRIVAGLLACAGLLVCLSQTAFAAQIVEPASRPFRFPADARGRPQPFTIVATGFAPGTLVYVEQCDGTSPRTPQWSPTLNCDLGSSPSAAIVDSAGRATFDARDPNRAFHPFVGESPQQLLTCAAGGSCTVRVSTNNSAPTADQVFMPITLPAPSSAGAATTPVPAGSQAGSVSATAAPASARAANAAAGASATGQPGATTATGGRNGTLAFTGLTQILAIVGLECLAIGVAFSPRRRARAVANRRSSRSARSR